MLRLSVTLLLSVILGFNPNLFDDPRVLELPCRVELHSASLHVIILVLHRVHLLHFLRDKELGFLKRPCIRMAVRSTTAPPLRHSEGGCLTGPLLVEDIANGRSVRNRASALAVVAVLAAIRKILLLFRLTERRHVLIVVIVSQTRQVIGPQELMLPGVRLGLEISDGAASRGRLLAQLAGLLPLKLKRAAGAHLLQNFAFLIFDHHFVKVRMQVLDQAIDLGFHGVPLHVPFPFAPFQEAMKVGHDIVALGQSAWLGCCLDRSRSDRSRHHGHVVVDDRLPVHVFSLVLHELLLSGDVRLWKIQMIVVLLIQLSVHLKHVLDHFLVDELLGVLARDGGACLVTAVVRIGRERIGLSHTADLVILQLTLLVLTFELAGH